MAVLTHTALKINNSTASNAALALTSLLTTVSVGETVFVVVVGTSASATVADNSASAGSVNVYTLDSVNNSASVRCWVFRCNVTRAIATTNTITITFNANNQRKAATAFKVAGWLTPAALDKTATNTGTTSPMSTGTTTAIARADEFVLAAYASATSGGPIYTDTSGMTKGNIASAVLTGQSLNAVYAWKETAAIATQAGSGTIDSVPTSWAAAILTYPATAGSAFTKTVTGAVAFSGTRPKMASNRKVTGVLAFVGARTSAPKTRLVTAVFAPAGALVGASSRLARTVTASFTPSGALSSIKASSKAISGALSFVGSVAHSPNKALAAILAPTGSIARQQILGRVLTATLAPVGVITKASTRLIAAVLHPTGAIFTTPRTLLVQGVFRPVGVIAHGLPARTLFGTLNFATDMSRLTAHFLFGALQSASVLHTNYLPPTPPGAPGGGGHGALMSDEFFQRYSVDGKWAHMRRVRVK